MLVDGASYFDALAQVLERATRTVYFACWDIDSRIPLRRDDQGKGTPLRDILSSLVRRNPGLEIFFLSWDFAMIYTFEREHLPRVKLGWRTPDQIHFAMDNEHPLGASHHQKFVVADDQLAFVGGIDLTHGRWDTPSHKPDDPRRITPADVPYLPFHDVQVAVDRCAARSLGDLYRKRWRHATGNTLKPPPKTQKVDPWPPSIQPDIENISVGLAQTLPAYRNRPAKTEIRNLYVDTLQSAKHYVYIENQYLTSHDFVDVVAASLAMDDGPEILIVLPKKSEGWLEEKTMNALRRKHLKRLFECDTHDRLRVFYPHVEGLGKGWINVHAKLLIADDRLGIFGSANLSNRSMGLDTECNLAFEAQTNEERASIAHLRNRLLGEHLGLPPEDVGNLIENRESIFDAVTDLQGGVRSLKPLPTEPPDEDGIVLRHKDLADPERPISFDDYVDNFMLEKRTVSKLRGAIPVFLLVAALIVLALLWNIPSLAESFSPAAIAKTLQSISSNPAAPLLMVTGFVVLGLVSFPVTVLFMVTALLFEPYLSIPISLAGSLASAATTYGIGRILGHDYVKNLAGRRVNALSRWVSKRGLLKTALIRMIPSAPFSVINVVAGASHLHFFDYLLGTALGMLPGILAITILGDLAIQLLLHPTPTAAVVFAGILALVVGVSIWFAKRSRPVDGLPIPPSEKEKRA